MKTKNFIVSIIALVSLTACDWFNASKERKTDIEDPVPQEPIHQHTYSSSWSNDDDYHWHAATCEHTSEVSYKSPHKYGDWVVDIEPTLTTAGQKHRTCSTCAYIQNQTMDAVLRDGNSVEFAFNIEEFIEKTKLLEINVPSSTEYYVTGVVKGCSYNAKYGSYSFYFENHDTAEKDIAYVYSCKFDSSIDSSSFSTNPSSLNGKTVTLYGYFLKYFKVGNDIKYEISYLNATESPSGKESSPLILYIDNGQSSHTHTYSDSWSNNEAYHWHAATCEHNVLTKDKALHDYSEWVIDKDASYISDGSKHKTCSVCGYVYNETIDRLVTGTGTFTLYSFNDFHGAVQEYPSSGHVGLAKFGTYLKNVSGGNTLIVDSGDTYQGSIESNYNNGAMVTDVFNYAGVDVHTLGNHDFDWGQEKLIANKNRKDANGQFATHFLGANVYDYNFATLVEGKNFQSKFGDKYYIKTLDNGLRIGVIGVVEREQITSICSPLVEDICFKEHINIIQSISDTLRSENKVDAIIASIHGSATNNMELGLTDISPKTNKKYVDYVCCGHSHQNECYKENDVYYTQAACYGEMLYKSTFTLNSGNVTNVSVTRLNYNDITTSVRKIDTNISNIIASYSKEYSSIGNQVIASSTSGTFSKTEQAPNLLAKALYFTAKDQGYNVDFAITNDARYNLTGTSWTYADIYEAFPFDNVMYVVKVKGYKNAREIGYTGNYIYHNASATSVNSNTWYTVAIIDYLLFHTNTNRNYDYFDHSSSNMQILGFLKNTEGSNLLYRDIFVNYVKGLTGTISANDYKTTGNFAVPKY